MKVMVHVRMYHTCDHDNNTHLIWDMERVKTRNREVVEVKWWDLFCLKIERRLDLILLVDWLRLSLTVVSTAVLNAVSVKVQNNYYIRGYEKRKERDTQQNIYIYLLV